MKKFQLIILLFLKTFIENIQIKNENIIELNNGLNNLKSPYFKADFDKSLINNEACFNEKLEGVKIDAKILSTIRLNGLTNIEKECHEKCQNTNECVTYAYNKDNFECLLYENTNGTFLNNISWNTVFPQIKINNLISWYTASDIHIKKFNRVINNDISNSYECWKLCIGDKDCNAFTFDILNKICYFSNSNSIENFFFKTNCLSGYRHNDSKLSESYLGFQSLNKKIRKDIPSKKISYIMPIDIESCFKSCNQNKICNYLSVEVNENETIKCIEYDHSVDLVEDINENNALFEKDIDFMFDDSFKYYRTLNENYSKSTCSLNTKRSKRKFGIFGAIAAVFTKIVTKITVAIKGAIAAKKAALAIKAATIAAKNAKIASKVVHPIVKIPKYPVSSINRGVISGYQGAAPWKLVGLPNKAATTIVAPKTSAAIYGLGATVTAGGIIIGSLGIAGVFNNNKNPLSDNPQTENPQSDNPENPYNFDDKTNDIMNQLEESMQYISLLLHSVGKHVKSNPSTQSTTLTSTSSTTTTSKKPKCKNPPEFENSDYSEYDKLSCTNKDLGSKCEVKCKPKYFPVPEIFKCENDGNGNGKWMEQNADNYPRFKRQADKLKTCERRCTDMPQMDNSNFNLNDKKDCTNNGKGKGIGGHCNLKCTIEYEPNVEKVICEEKNDKSGVEWVGYQNLYGQKTKVQYKCNLKKCLKAPRDINNNNVDNSDFSKNKNECDNTNVSDKCELKCKPGFNEIPIAFNCTVDINGPTWRTPDTNASVKSFCIKSNYIFKNSENNEYCLQVLLNKQNHTAYCGNYNIQKMLPKWNIYYKQYGIRDKYEVKTRDEISLHRGLQRREPWENNPLIDANFQQDLRPGELNTEFNRGHLVPVNEMRYTMKAALSTFLLTNMAPQNKTINAQSWEKLERLVEKFGNNFKKILIVTGVCLNKIMDSKFKVYNNPPKCFWKLLCLKLNGQENVIGFYQDNEKINNYEILSQYNLLNKIGNSQDYLDDLWKNEKVSKLLNSEIDLMRCGEKKHLSPEDVGFWNKEFNSMYSINLK